MSEEKVVASDVPPRYLFLESSRYLTTFYFRQAIARDSTVNDELAEGFKGVRRHVRRVGRHLARLKHRQSAGRLGQSLLSFPEAVGQLRRRLLGKAQTSAEMVREGR